MRQSPDTEFWTARGLKVTSVHRVATASEEDTNSIYELTSADALATIRNAGELHADVLLLSGTGMATLPALADIRASTGLPVLTSNQSLVVESLRRLGVAGTASH